MRVYSCSFEAVGHKHQSIPTKVFDSLSNWMTITEDKVDHTKTLLSSILNVPISRLQPLYLNCDQIAVALVDAYGEIDQTHFIAVVQRPDQVYGSDIQTGECLAQLMKGDWLLLKARAAEHKLDLDMPVDGGRCIHVVPKAAANPHLMR